MVAIVANARYFNQNTDYPADQTAYLTSGTLVVPASSNSTATIAHNLPFTPLVGGNWALTSDFSVSYEYSSGPLTSPINTTNIYDTIACVYADATNVYVTASTPSAGNKTIYFRMYGFEPSNSTATLTQVASLADNFTIRTDYNLTKLYINTTALLTAGGGAGSQVDFIHGLGYIPQAQAWIQANGYVHPAPTSSTSPVPSQTVVSPGTNMISFGIVAGELAQQAWLRIYADD